MAPVVKPVTLARLPVVTRLSGLRKIETLEIGTRIHA
jgi:hypothetical protein